MQSLSVFREKPKFADSWWKSADVRRTQGMSHLICIFFGPSLGKAQVCQISLL